MAANKFSQECQKPKFRMSFKVHKIFALYALNQSQLHKRYPPACIKTDYDDGKRSFPKASAQAGGN